MTKLTSLFKAKNHDAGWCAVAISARAAGLAKVDLDGVMPRVKQCEYHQAQEISAALLDKVCRGAGLSKHDFTTLLAAGDYQMLLVEAPNVPVNELKTAVRWKIKDSLSYHVDDATVDVLQIPAGKYGAERGQAMFAIAAANTVIQKRIALFEQAGLGLDVIDIPEMAQRNIAALFEQEGRALVLLAFDDDGGLLTFTAGGELFLARRIDISAGQLQDADDNLRQQCRDRVELELQRSLDYFDRQYNHIPVSRVLVSAPEAADLAGFLAADTDLNVEPLDLSQVMDISAVPALTDSTFIAQTLTTLGAALRREGRAL